MAKLSPPVFYLVMRSDLQSLGCGKACAQAAHAGSKFILEADEANKALIEEWQTTTFEERLVSTYSNPVGDYEMVRDLLSVIHKPTTRGFGTGITLSAKNDTIKTMVKVAKEMGLYTSFLTDPSYPLDDGETRHYLPVMTCAFMFGRDDDCKVVLNTTRRIVASDSELNWAK